MNASTPAAADTRSPWTDSFRAVPDAQAAADRAAADFAPMRGSEAALAEAPRFTCSPNGLDREADRWTSEALFDLYNLR
jgi:hypothetical protein